MRGTPARSYRQEFARSAAYRREQELFAKDAERRVKDEQESDRVDNDADTLTTIAALATEADLAEFRLKLDALDTANTDALLDNERLLQLAKAKVDELLGDAYILPDGRRVFKTKDGRVVDEKGVELGPDEVDPDLIEDWRPGYEDYLSALEEKGDLEQERQDLLDFQERIDDAREEIEADDLTKQDIEAIEDELKASMPDAARERMPDYEAAEIPAVRNDFSAAASATKVVVPDLKRDLQQLIQ